MNLYTPPLPALLYSTICRKLNRAICTHAHWRRRQICRIKIDLPKNVTEEIYEGEIEKWAIKGDLLYSDPYLKPVIGRNGHLDKSQT